MNTKLKTIIGIALFIAFIGIAYISYTALSEKYKSDTDIRNDGDSSTEEKKYKAPDFTVFDKQGNQIKLSNFIGKPVVLNFWASWCPPCKSEMPHFNEAYEEYKDDVVFMMVDLVDGQRETQAKGEKYVQNQGFTFPVYFDNEQSAAYAYAISSIPITLFIDSDGYIVTGYQGAIEKETLLQEMGAILNTDSK